MPTEWDVIRMSQAIHWTTAELLAAAMYVSAGLYLAHRLCRRLFLKPRVLSISDADLDLAIDRVAEEMTRDH